MVVALAPIAVAASEKPAQMPIPPLLQPDVAQHTEQASARPIPPATVLPRDGQSIETAEASEEPHASRWMVAVRLDEGPAAVLVKLRAALATEQWLFAIGLLTATLAVGGLTLRTVGRHSGSAARRRRSSVAVDQMVRRASLVSLDDPDERVLSELRTTTEQLRANAELLLDELASAPPLRGVLRQEVDLISQRLSDVPRTNGIVGPRQIRQRYQGGIRELHRVIKIAEGAAASFSVGALRPNVPTSREEAYDMLGVNDSISDATLKKLVDALRLSWHPDHARDEPDRQRREERIKQINVAWDLIVGKRLTT